MTDIDHIKSQILKALDCTQDAILLDLVYKLLITES